MHDEELSVLSEHYRAEIAVTDVQSGRRDVYGRGRGFARRAYLLFAGIHYDAAAFGGGARVVTPASHAGAAAAVARLATARRRDGGFVDKQTMRLRCKICGFVAEGDYEARAHAGGTGHKEFAPA